METLFKIAASLFWWLSEAIWLIVHSDRANFILHHVPIIFGLGGSFYLWLSHPISWLWIVAWILSVWIGAKIEKKYIRDEKLFVGTMFFYRLLFGIIPISFIASVMIVLSKLNS